MDYGIKGAATSGLHKIAERRLAALMISVICVTGITLAGPATAVETGGRLRTSTPQVATSGKMIFAGKLPSEIRRSIKLQRKTSWGWLLVVKGTTTRRGKFDLTATAPSRSGTYTFRVKAPRKVTTAKTYEAIKTPTVKVSVLSPPPPTPAPPPPSLGSRENPYPINTYFTSGPWGFTVGVTDTDAWPEIFAQNQYNDAPLAGWSYVMVPVTFTYIGTGSSRPWSSEVEFLGSNSAVYDGYDANTDQSCGDVPNDWDYLPELYPGGSAAGNVCAVVPTSAISGGLWRLSGDYGTTQRFSRLN